MKNRQPLVEQSNYFQGVINEVTVNNVSRPSVAKIGSTPIGISSLGSTQYSSVSDLINDNRTADIVVWTRAPEFKEIMGLRQDRRYRYRLVLCSSDDVSHPASSLLDKRCKPEQWNEIWKQWENRLSQSPFNHVETVLTGQDALLLYLWLNPTRTISPVVDETSSQIYSYPLLSLLFEQEADNYLGLQSLLQQDLIEQDGSLVDRIRLCRSCHHAHLNYIETCPHCNSIDIATERAIHCFTCGHVDNQDQFIRQNTMSCPNCLTSRP